MWFGILGPLEVVGDSGSRVELGARRQRAVLAILLVHLNEVVSLDRLIDEVWGETPPNAATASIQAYVSNLRRVLEPARTRRAPARVLVTEPPGYALRVEPEAIDAHRFEHLAAEGRAALAAGQGAGALHKLDEALSQWRGEPLAEFTYEAFAGAEIMRLEELRALTEEDRVEALLMTGDNGGACSRLDPLISRYPLRERLRILHMLALYRSGRQADALRAYDHTREVLGEELGLDPGPELERVRHQILTHDPSLQATSAPISDSGSPAEASRPAAGPTRQSSMFVGRERDLARLRAALDEAIAGTTRIVCVGGEAGIGKSRLASELVNHARTAGVLTAWGRCHDDEGAPPLWPWVQVLRGLGVADAGVSDHVRAALGAVLPELGGAGAAVLDVDSARFRLYDAVCQMTERTARVQPVLVVLEDVHWADVTSLRLLRFFAVELRAAPVLVVATIRDSDRAEADPIARAVADVLGEPSVVHMTLEGLSLQDVTALIDEGTEAGAASRAIAEEIYRRTDGNPFFVAELVRLLSSERRLTRDAAASDIPAVVGDVIRRRIGRLPDDVQTVLGVASVIGREFDEEVLRRACGLDADSLLDVLEIAVLTRIVATSGDGSYRFAHALLSETLYADLNPVRRARLHLRVGEAIEAVFASDLEPRVSQLAHHFGRARAGVRAVEYALLAAEQAEHRLAFDDAMVHWRSVLAALAALRSPQAAERGAVLLRLASAMRRTGDEAGGSAVNDEALAIAEQCGDLTLLAEAALAYGEIGLWQVRPYGTVDVRVVAAISRALAGTDDRDTALRARLLVGLAIALYYDEGQRERGEELARDGVAMARRLDDRRLLAETLVELLVMLDTSPDLAQQLAMAEELVELQGPDIPIDVGTTARMRAARLRLASGDASLLQPDIERAAREADVDRQPLVQMWATWARTTIAFLRGQLSEAESLATVAFELHQHVGIWGATETYGLHMMLIWREQGRMTEMAPIVEPILRDTVHPSAPKMLGIFAIERGAVDEIPAILGPDPIPRARDFTWLADLCVTAELAAAAHLPCCRELYETLLPFRDRIVTMDGTFFCMGAASRYLGMLADSLNRRREAVTHLERAVELDDRIGAIPWSVRSRWHLAHVLDHGSRAARDVLIDAHRIAADHDLVALRSMTRDGIEGD